MKYKATILMLLLNCLSVFANNNFIAYSKQLIVVTAKNQNSIHARIQLWQRASTNSSWHKYGSAFPAVIGANGITKNKLEGDNKTPAGIFPITTAFGIAAQGNKLTKMPYIHITPTTACVDDPKSTFYNQIVDSNKISKPDWRSYEPMALYAATYKLGLVIGSNMHPTVPGKGSCIFLHIWISNDTTTPGCIAISKDNMQKLLQWLKPAANPKVLIKTSQKTQPKQLHLK